MATNKFMYNGENTTIKWAWLTADNNPYWSFTPDADIDEFVSIFTETLTNDCGKYRISLTIERKEVREWEDYYDEFADRDLGGYTSPEVTFSVYGWVHDCNAKNTIQNVCIEVGSHDEATHTVEELAHKAVKWCLNRR